MSQVETLSAPILPPPAEDKWRREQRAFWRLLPELLETHRGRYVAIHEEKLVESGDDKLAVAGRAYAQFGYVPIYVGLVTDQPPPLSRIPSPRLRAGETVMIRYGYNRQIAPPAPFIHVALRCIETGRELTQVPAQLDTAADKTVLPGHCVAELGLLPLDELSIGGFGGQVLLVLSYRVQVRVHEWPPVMIEAIAHTEEPFVLLGRDVLNQHRLLLDGPQLLLELG